MVRIHIRRALSADNEEALVHLINGLRSTLAGWPGYLSSETLRRVEPPGEILVVSKWQSRFYWEQWYKSQERQVVQEKIDALLNAPTQYEIYEYE